MTGGDVPKGKYAQQVYASSGAVQDDNASLVLGTKDPGTGRSTQDFDLVMADSNVFVRPHGSSRDWFTSWTFIAEEFIPGVRLNLVRETVLLAPRISKSTTFSGGAFQNRYTVSPAADQLRQLMSFSTSGTLTFSLASGSNRLTGINGHFVGTDTSNHRHVVVDSVLTFSNFGRPRPVQVPPGGVSVQPADLFSTTAGQ